MTKRSPEIIACLRRMAPDAPAVEIARELSVTVNTVIRWAGEEGIKLMTRSQASKKALADPEVRARMSAASKKAWADPEVRARMSAARKKAWADPEVRARIKATRKGAKGVLIPKWVPLDLQDEFLDVAAERGEEAAASHVRRLKREMVA